MKKALITGITGQDGSSLAEFLLAKGYEVHGMIRRTSLYVRQRIDHLTSNPAIKDKTLFLHYGDLTDGSNISRLIEKIMPDEVYNLAAQSHVKISFDVPEYSAQVDAIGTIRILDAIREVSPKTKFYQACHDNKTRVVTPNGILNYKDIKVGDLVYSINEKTNQLEIQIVKRIHEYDFNDNLITLQGKRINQAITPNHNVLLQHDNGEFIRSEAQDLNKLFKYDRQSFLSLPRCKLEGQIRESINLLDYIDLLELEQTNNFHKNLQTKFDTNDFMYLLGLYIGDGYKASKHTINKNFNQQARQKYRNKFGCYITTPQVEKTIKNSTTILYAIPKTDPTRKKLTKCLDRIGLNYTEQKMTITVTSLPLSKVFSLAGNIVYDKQIPDFVWNFDASHLKYILEGIIDSDGHSRKTKNYTRNCITTSSKKLAAQCLVLSMICGKYPSLKEFKPGEQISYITENSKKRKIINTVSSFYININTKSTNKIYSYMLDKQKYCGKVWCFEVKDNHNFLVERDGKIAFSGNSTSELFGKVSESPQNEKTPFYPRSPYAAAKLYAYWITVNYREAYNLFACNGILFNHESERRGENFVTRKITLSAANIVCGRQEKLSLGNLAAKRDWGYAPDYVESMWLMLNATKPGDYVIASGEQHSVEEFCSLVFARMEMPLTFKGEGLERKGYDSNGIVRVDVNPKYFRPTEVETLLGDASKAKYILGWEPKTTFKELVNIMADHDLKKAKNE